MNFLTKLSSFWAKLFPASFTYKMKASATAAFFIFFAFGATAVFQNCMRSRFGMDDKESERRLDQCTDPNCQQILDGVGSCTFNGQTVAHGQSVTAYQSSTAPNGLQCISQQRTCNNGILSGDYQYASCATGAPQNCLFNGQTINHGQSVTAYLTSTVPNGQTCQSEVRTCNNGSLSGNHQYANCSVGAPASCQFNGQTIAHGSGVFAYQASTVPNGQSCTAEFRLCQNGQLNGTFTYGSCAPMAPAACLFDGQTIGSGSAVIAYQNSTVPFGQQCVPESRVCTNGTLSGSYNYSSCSIGTPAACLFNGQTIPSGSGVIGFQNSTVPAGNLCNGESRVCTNGVLSGSFPHASCAQGTQAACQFNGQTVNSGTSVIAFQNSAVPFGQQCLPETRSCTNGQLSGSFTFASCTVGGAASCSFNGQTIAHGEAVIAFQNSTVDSSQSCVQQPRVCNNGQLSGSYAYASCTPGQPASCMFNGQTVAHNQSILAYKDSSVPSGQSCVAQVRTCYNGTLAGTYAFGSCTVGQPASCIFNGYTIPNGCIVTAYQNSTPTSGGVCVFEKRKCENGVLVGNYQFSHCTHGTGASCQFNGQTIAHQQSVVAYAQSTVPQGQQCQAQSRTCNNGVLSGSYASGSCQVQGASASCSFNGQTIPHGGSVQAYASSSVNYGNTCTAQTRTCNNGVLSGSYTHGTCSVQGHTNCTFNGQTVAHGTKVIAYHFKHYNWYMCAYVKEERYCNNGALSGTAPYSTCPSTDPDAIGYPTKY